MLSIASARKQSFLLPNHPPAAAASSRAFLQEEIYSSSYAAAAYLESIKFPSDKKVYVVGEAGIEEELDLKGIAHVGGPADGEKTVELTPGRLLEHDHDVRLRGGGGILESGRDIGVGGIDCGGERS